jgi:uncharacterized protein YceK
MTRRLAICICVLAVLSGCKGSYSPTSPSSSSIDGTYAGAMNDSSFGAGTLRMTLTSNGSNVTGTWTTLFSGGNNGGTGIGTFNGTTLSITLTPTTSGCPFLVTATRSRAQLSGNYMAVNCANLTGSGSINLSKQ